MSLLFRIPLIKFLLVIGYMIIKNLAIDLYLLSDLFSMKLKTVDFINMLKIPMNLIIIFNSKLTVLRKVNTF